MRALLDVNVLIALLDASHIHHRRASAWLESEIKHGWASCPLTQNGCLRIMSQPSYPQGLNVSLVAERLAQATDHLAHRFIPDDYSLLDAEFLDWSRLLGHRQITDAYLLGLAVNHGCRFVSFDARIDPKIIGKATSKHWVTL
ncbi:MAG: PIN domain-containing protein [Burkholderiaceae bacterium]|nr:PIN domain-containing protein [Burkholderiaceae bacterium]MCD8565981.1 PIN domain-containing protein [Burkholderiaceae bacterium]